MNSVNRRQFFKYLITGFAAFVGVNSVSQAKRIDDLMQVVDEKNTDSSLRISNPVNKRMYAQYGSIRRQSRRVSRRTARRTARRNK